jgi:ATP-binding cassette subfamily B protein/subfamily B ATP-binding cassette protein MsbA
LLIVLATMVLHVGLDVLRPWPVALLLNELAERLGVDNPAHEDAVSPLFTGLLTSLPSLAGIDGLFFWICVSTVAIFVAGTLISMLGTWASVGLGQRMSYDLGADLFLHLQRLSVVFHSRRPTGDTIARVTGDTYCVQALISDALLPLLESLLAVTAMFALMWSLQPTMACVALAVAPFLMLSIWFFGAHLKDRSRQSRDLEGHMMTVVEQSLSAIPAVQANTREELEWGRFRRYAREAVRAHLRATLASMWFKAAAGLVTAVGTAVLMWLGAKYTLAGELRVGDVWLFLAYVVALYAPLDSITYTASTWQRAAADADRVLELLDTPADVRDRPGARAVPLRGHVRYEDVSFGYEPGRAVLKGISLEAKPGDVIAIVGPTGAGKTTLVNLLVRFFDPWSGRVTVDGHDLRDLKVRSLRQQAAMVLQDPFIFPLTIAENIAYGRPEATHAEVVAAAKAASADEFIHRLPGGYEAVVGERGATLSGGEKQRLSIARALLKDAPILILDEPTSALDARTEGLLLDALDRLMQGRTTFIIAHRLSTIRNADWILVVNQGEIAEQGTHRDLMKLGGLYAALYCQQMEVAQHDRLRMPVASGQGGPA